MDITGGSSLSLLSPNVATGLRVSGGTRSSSQRRPRATRTVGCDMSSDGGGEDVLNPLARGDPERARVNNLITILAETPMNQWKPAILDEYMSSLLKRGIYRQAMAERLAKVRSGEDQEALVRVDAYLTGFLGQESRRASRKKVKGGGRGGGRGWFSGARNGVYTVQEHVTDRPLYSNNIIVDPQSALLVTY